MTNKQQPAWKPSVLKSATTGMETAYATVSEIRVDDAYQRGINEHDVAAIVDNFDPRQMEPLTVSRRADGNLYVVDGQHRRPWRHRRAPPRSPRLARPRNRCRNRSAPRRPRQGSPGGGDIMSGWHNDGGPP